MARLEISKGEALYYEYVAPTASAPEAKTFVFVNALTGNTGMWSGTICAQLHEAGFGTLCYNFRGQVDTEFADKTALTPSLIVEDLKLLMEKIAPPSPILVGLSIGGLFAAQAFVAGAEACGLVLINTLRKPSQRLNWINQAMVAMAKLGGGRLVMTANMPMIASPDLLAKMYDATFTDEPFEAPSENDGLLRLMIGSLETNWNFAYEKLNVPVLILTGKFDRIFRIEEDIAELKTRIPDAIEKRYVDAGHLIPLEVPETLVRELIDFAEVFND